MFSSYSKKFLIAFSVSVLCFTAVEIQCGLLETVSAGVPCCDTIFGSHMSPPNNCLVCSVFKCTKFEVPNSKCPIPDCSINSYDELSKMSQKSCPGGIRKCPANMNCCINDRGEGDCCSDPSSHDTQVDDSHNLFETRCIDDLGCFYTGPPFYHSLHRPYSVLPSYDLSTQFLLYNHLNIIDPQVLVPTNESLRTSNLNVNYETKILIHGFIEKLDPDDIFFKIKNELLKRPPMNVVIVNWSEDNQFPYHQAVANARVIGAQVAKFINYHVERKHLDPKTVHIIGHSLGAHVSGWAGERVPQRVGRITGLDPAGPWFHKAANEVHLDTSDADFVDVIHTNGGNTMAQGFGIAQPIGHLDFYPNGGRQQPGCFFEGLMCTGGERNRTTNLISNICSHNRANEIFLASINNLQYEGVQCKNYKDFSEGKCTSENSKVAGMGYSATKHSTPTEGTRFHLQATV